MWTISSGRIDVALQGTAKIPGEEIARKAKSQQTDQAISGRTSLGLEKGRTFKAMSLGNPLLGLLLAVNSFAEAAAFTTPLATVIGPELSVADTISGQPSPVQISVESVTATLPTSLPPLPRTTVPPSLNHLDLRQRCWNDQGFSVDCAVWTGYRYTWGPSSNPYDYWSGNGGSGSGQGGTTSSAAASLHSSRNDLVAILVMCVGVGLLAIVHLL